MSWELEHLKRRGWNHRGGSPIALIGFVLGLVAMSTSVFIYFWLVAAIAPLMLVGVFAIASLVAGRHSGRIVQLADGALAAAVFALVFTLIFTIGLGQLTTAQ